MARLSRITNKASVRKCETERVQTKRMVLIIKPFSVLQHSGFIRDIYYERMDIIRRNGSSTRWRKLRAFVLKRDNNTCYYCGIPTANTVDHLTPIDKGGTDELSNLVAACSHCNYSKGSKTEQQFNRKRARKKKEREMIRFFEHDKTPPTPATSFSPKALKSPFELPKGVSCND